MTTIATRARGMRIGELAAAVALSPETIRYYEKAGLLPQPQRTPAGYREYDGAAIDRLSFIQGAQRLGLTLTDIRDLLAVRDTGECPCEPAEQLLARRADRAADCLAHRDGCHARRPAQPRLPPADAWDVVLTGGR